MKQVRLHGPQDLRIDEVPMPVAGPRGGGQGRDVRHLW